jgi:MFS family permease
MITVFTSDSSACSCSPPSSLCAFKMSATEKPGEFQQSDHLDVAKRPSAYSDFESTHSTKRTLALLSLILVFIGSQEPLYFVAYVLSGCLFPVAGSSRLFFKRRLQLHCRRSWWLGNLFVDGKSTRAICFCLKSSVQPTAYSLVLAATCPFTGSLSDLVGRRNLVLIGCTACIVGLIVIGTAHDMNVAIVGMAILGSGAGTTELTAVRLSFLLIAHKRNPNRSRGSRN